MNRDFSGIEPSILVARFPQKTEIVNRDSSGFGGIAIAPPLLASPLSHTQTECLKSAFSQPRRCKFPPQWNSLGLLLLRLLLRDVLLDGVVQDGLDAERLHAVDARLDALLKMKCLTVNDEISRRNVFNRDKCYQSR